MSEITAPITLCKDPSEKRRFQMDFSNLLASGETVVTIISVTSTKIGGGTSNLVISSTAIDDGNKVSFWIENGSEGRYRIKVKVVTSSTAILSGNGILRVTDT